jgi:hypothetical protein
MKRKQLWLSPLTFFLAIGIANAQTYININVPGAGSGPGQGTFPQNVTDSGVIFGNYVDSSGARSYSQPEQFYLDL